MTGADFPDDLVFVVNTPAQAKYLLHSQEQAAGGIDLNMNMNATKFKCFKQEGAIFTFSSKSLKLVDQFIYLGNNISSTESDDNICRGEAWI